MNDSILLIYVSNKRSHLLILNLWGKKLNLIQSLGDLMKLIYFDLCFGSNTTLFHLDSYILICSKAHPKICPLIN